MGRPRLGLGLVAQVPLQESLWLTGLTPSDQLRPRS